MKEPLKIKETLVLSECADNIPGSELLVDSLNKYISSDDITESTRRIERLRNILWLIKSNKNPENIHSKGEEVVPKTAKSSLDMQNAETLTSKAPHY